MAFRGKYRDIGKVDPRDANSTSSSRSGNSLEAARAKNTRHMNPDAYHYATRTATDTSSFQNVGGSRQGDSVYSEPYDPRYPRLLDQQEPYNPTSPGTLEQEYNPIYPRLPDEQRPYDPAAPELPDTGEDTDRSESSSQTFDPTRRASALSRPERSGKQASDSQHIPEVYEGYITSKAIKKLEDDYRSKNAHSDESNNSAIKILDRNMLDIDDGHRDYGNNKRDANSILTITEQIDNHLRGLATGQTSQKDSYAEIAPLMRSAYDIATSTTSPEIKAAVRAFFNKIGLTAITKKLW